VPNLKPKVTIGVCVRNCEKTISEAIESIIIQDYPHELMEVIFVDDGSEDRTFEVIKDYLAKMDMNVKVFRHKWKGIGFSRNVVLKNANGDHIIWIDGDMKIPSNYTRKLVEFMDKHPNVGIAKGKQSLKKGANLLGTLETYSRAASRMVNYKSPKAKYKSLGTGGATYRVKALQQVGEFDENLRGYYEDFDIELRMKTFGWTLDTVDIEFSDYERQKIYWKDLWIKYWLRGYYAHHFVHKHNGAIKLYKMSPILAFIAGLLSSIKLYQLKHQTFVFLLPFHFFFKFCAWNLGFLASYLNAYGK
jgi:glycosyltransferase involved in cell wall biosynthesis